eukprot:COSAG02_NODE_1256_length_13576_cov_12.901981_4_plen_395_part_00
MATTMLSMAAPAGGTVAAAFLGFGAFVRDSKAWFPAIFIWWALCESHGLLEREREGMPQLFAIMTVFWTVCQLFLVSAALTPLDIHFVLCFRHGEQQVCGQARAQKGKYPQVVAIGKKPYVLFTVMVFFVGLLALCHLSYFHGPKTDLCELPGHAQLSQANLHLTCSHSKLGVTGSVEKRTSRKPFEKRDPKTGYDPTIYYLDGSTGNRTSLKECEVECRPGYQMVALSERTEPDKVGAEFFQDLADGLTGASPLINCGRYQVKSIEWIDKRAALTIDADGGNRYTPQTHGRGSYVRGFKLRKEQPGGGSCKTYGCYRLRDHCCDHCHRRCDHCGRRRKYIARCQPHRRSCRSCWRDSRLGLLLQPEGRSRPATEVYVQLRCAVDSRDPVSTGR